MNKGVYEKSEIGTPQCGNLSPLLSNIMLDKLDKELEARRLRYTRYADDCLIFVGSKAAATRVMHSVTRFIENKLGLKVNAEKSKITRPSKIKYLGFGYWKDNKTNQWRARVHETSFNRFKDKIKNLTTRKWSVPFDYRIKKLNEVTRGWINYFRIADMKSKLKRFSEQLRTRLRIIC
ncbi:MAG: reverse transcriptase domain-containing protein, partial [Finegoldia magna]|nr:reverse transcriptase domain-containing protein [Finegoldia magna]